MDGREVVLERWRRRRLCKGTVHPTRGSPSATRDIMAKLRLYRSVTRLRTFRPSVS